MKAILTIIKEGWDHPIVRLHTGDVASLGVGFNGIGGVGGGTSIEANWILHGKNISWLPIITVTQLIGGGFSVSATANAGVVNYLMPADSINKDRLVTNSLSGKGFAVPSAWASGGVAMGGKLGVTGTVSFDKYLNPTSIGRAVNLGFGLPTIILPIDGAIGISNTWIIYDFNN